MNPMLETASSSVYLLYAHVYDKIYTLQLTYKREVINTALRTLVRLYEQSSARELRGKLHWEGDLAELRQGRSHAGD